MKIICETDLRNFDAWQGGKDTMDELTLEELDQLEPIIEDAYPEGMTDTELNDLLWFERDTLAEWLGYRDWEALECHHSGEDEDDDESDDDE